VSVRRRVGVGAVTAVLVGALVSVGTALGRGTPAGADGPAPCTVGPPPAPGSGFCATYNGVNTWYGSYGPGFPVPLGWVFCAGPAGGGGDYPFPAYDYQPGNPPDGIATGPLGPLGFAFSAAQASGIWGGTTGEFSADQAGAAGKLLYDAVEWGTPIPSDLDAGTQSALGALEAWYDQATGITAPPTLAVDLAQAGSIPTSGAAVEVHASFPGSGGGVWGLAVSLSVSGGAFGAAGGPTTDQLTTDGSGVAQVTVVPTGSGPVTISAQAQTGQAGLTFDVPTENDLRAQVGVGVPAPVHISASATGTPAAATVPTGTISVQKTGNDQAYFGVAGAQFQVLDAGGSVVATLTTDAAGSTPESPPLLAGDRYVLHESVAPPGYSPAPDRDVVVQAGSDTVVHYSGPTVEQIIPGHLVVEKEAADADTPLAGAVFDVRYDAGNTATFGTDVGTCTTAASGTCTPADDVTGGLLPGRYQVTEVGAPPGYGIGPGGAMQDASVGPGTSTTVVFRDAPLPHPTPPAATTAQAAPTGPSSTGPVPATPPRPAVSTGAPAAAVLADTGGPSEWLPIGGVALLLAGLGLCVLRRRADRGHQRAPSVGARRP